MKNLDFDVRVRIEVRVLPRSCPYDMSEKIQWNGIENRINWEARLIASAFEKYFEDKVREELNYLQRE